MTREEHIAALEKYRDGILSGGISVPYDDLMIALDASITALRSPTPDPITGLMPCGCGGEGEGMAVRPKTGCGNCLSSRLYRVRHDHGLGAWKARERREVLECGHGIQGAIK